MQGFFSTFAVLTWRVFCRGLVELESQIGKASLVAGCTGLRPRLLQVFMLLHVCSIEDVTDSISVW